LDFLKIVPPLYFTLAEYHKYQIAEKKDCRCDIKHDIPLIHVALKNEKSLDNDILIVSGISQ